MRYVFLAIGALAASLFWMQDPLNRAEVRHQLAEVPGYSIMPD